MHGEHFSFPAPKYSAFTQRVRRYRPSQLLPVLAQLTAHPTPNFAGIDELRLSPPWSAMAIARESIVRGNEHRQATAAPNDVRKLMQLHHEVFVEPTEPSVTALMGPLIHEQITWQLHWQEELARALTLYGDPSLGEDLPWESVLGMSLLDAVRASLVLSLTVNHNGGRWNPSDLGVVYAHESRDLTAYVSREKVEVIAQSLTASLDDIRSQAHEYEASLPKRDPNLAKHPFNPLFGYPLVDLGKQGVWAPVGSLLWRSFFQEILYVRARRAFSNTVTQIIGDRHQAYVGRVIEHVATDLRPEIRYGKGGGKSSVDWFWITPDATILVECKSAGLSNDSRAGGGRFVEQVNRAIVKARAQIDRTAEHMGHGLREFESIPKDRRLLGLVITSDSIPMSNSGLPEYGGHGKIPSIVASSKALERLCSLPPDEVPGALMAIFDHPEKRRWDLEHALPEPTGTNYMTHPVIREAWTKLSPRPLH